MGVAQLPHASVDRFAKTPLDDFCAFLVLFSDQREAFIRAKGKEP
jgi:hypothetical protein